MLCWRLAFSILVLIAFAAPTRAAPDEDLLGKRQGYPLGTPATWFYDERVRVGSFSHLDDILPHETMRRSATPRPLQRATDEPFIRYSFEQKTYRLNDFLDRQRITGLLLIRNGQILAERYQYDRTADQRFVSQSIAKSITSLAIGIALAEKKITSLDDTVAKYVPRLAGSSYGETTIRNILRMSSGVRFNEAYDGNDDLKRFSIDRYKRDTIAALREFQTRDAEQGAHFHYASAETVNLVLVLRAVTGMSLTAYLTPRLWQPMGAEADASWAKLPDGTVSGAGSFNATLRDYGRLGMLLANDGMVDGKQLIPKDYLLDATDWHRQPDAFKPRKATPYFGYGYQFWLFPGETRRFALLGVYGQTIFVDPELKLVLVLTAAAKNAEISKETLGRERDAFWRGIVESFGGAW